MYLLHEHDDLRCDHSASISRDPNQFQDFAFSKVRLSLCFEKGVDIEDVASCLDFVVP